MDEHYYLEKQKNRCIASILSSKEREVDDYLPPEVSAELRSVILDEINSYHLSVINTVENKVNPEFMRLVREIHEYMKE